MSQRSLVVGILTLVTGLISSSGARAAELPLCSTVAQDRNAQALYISGSSAAEPLVRRIAAQMMKQRNVAIFYHPNGSCRAVNMLAGDLTRGPCTTDTCITGKATTYAFPAGQTDDRIITPTECRLDPAGTRIDIVLSDVFYETCRNEALPDQYLVSVKGPAVAMTFAVHQNSSRKYITADEAYFVFGQSCGGGIQPWTNTNTHFIRGNESGTASILSRAIGVPSSGMWGKELARFTEGSPSRAIQSALSDAAADAQQSGIAMLPQSILDDSPTRMLRPLAFRARGQQFAFYPDDVASKHDKRNVREGRYVPFGYLHLFMRRSETPNNGAHQFYRLFDGTFTLESFDLRRATIDAHYIPQCAMKVQRNSDSVNAKGYFDVTLNDHYTCRCLFEHAADPQHKLPDGCATCGEDKACAGGKACIDGYCAE